MLFNYKVINTEGKETKGQIEAANSNIAVTTLQKKGFVVISVDSAEKTNFVKKYLPFLDKVALKDIVMMTRQAATLFEAQISAVRVFTLLSENSENKGLKQSLDSVTEDIKGGMTISDAMTKQPKVFSPFFVNMVKAGEESGKMTDIFNFLASYLERSHALTSKTKNALIYPAFIVFTFIIVMVLMLTSVIPEMAEILIQSGSEIPIYTKIVIGLSNLFVDYGIFLLLFLVILGFYLFRSLRTKKGKAKLDQLKLQLPMFGNLFRKTYLARIADNINTMIAAGIPVVKTLEISSKVVDNTVYSELLLETLEEVKGGSTISSAMSKHEEIPAIMVQMIKVGEETGSLAKVLGTLAKFYTQEVKTTVDTLISMIEPMMIVLLGLGVGFLLASVLIPIYNVASSI